jgi:hypothetical protein
MYRLVIDLMIAAALVAAILITGQILLSLVSTGWYALICLGIRFKWRTRSTIRGREG